MKSSEEENIVRAIIRCHEATKHHYDRYARSAGYMDWENQPNPFRIYEKTRVFDLPLLAERFLARITERDSRATWIDDDAMAILRRYPWPGNVRELESVLERALHLSSDGTIHASDLPDAVRQGRVMTSPSAQPQPLLTMVDAEREAILRAGWVCQGRVSEMARNLGIGRTTLWRKMKRHNITPGQFKI